MIKFLRWVALPRQQYDSLVDNLQGLRRGIETHEKALSDLHRQMEEQSALIDTMRREYSLLNRELDDVRQSAASAEKVAVFRSFQSIFTQLPTVEESLRNGANIAAKDVLSLLSPLKQWLTDAGFAVIGSVGVESTYDPWRHQMADPGLKSPDEETQVQVRYVGYMLNGDVICKAEVVPTDVRPKDMTNDRSPKRVK